MFLSVYDQDHGTINPKITIMFGEVSGIIEQSAHVSILDNLDGYFPIKQNKTSTTG